MAQVNSLNALGFTWIVGGQARNDARWEAMLERLVVFKDMPQHGHCRVPRRWAKDGVPALGNWVHQQMVYKWKLDRGEPNSGIMAARVASLNALGFTWRTAF